MFANRFHRGSTKPLLFFLFIILFVVLFVNHFCFLVRFVVLDTKEWLSTERDRARMATFGSRANLPPALASTATSANNASKASTHNHMASPQPHEGVIDVTDETWKTELEVGSLLDARDTAQVWYQVSVPHRLRVCCRFSTMFLLTLSVFVNYERRVSWS